MASWRLHLGILLAAPATILTGLLYVLPLWWLGWATYYGKQAAPVECSPLGVGWVFVVSEERCPAWLLAWWKGWGGHCVGSIVVLRQTPEAKGSRSTLLHELHHVHQFHRLGLLQPLLYVASSLAVWGAEEASYSANSFEAAARRAAGQIVDTDSFTKGYLYAKTGK